MITNSQNNLENNKICIIEQYNNGISTYVLANQFYSVDEFFFDIINTDL